MFLWEAPDKHYARAAEGWLELGNAAEALQELDGVHASLQREPDVLLMRWALCEKLGKWEDAYRVSVDLLAVIPDDIRSWLHQATALANVPKGGYQAAYDALLPAAKRFPDCWEIHFHLARWACQAGRMEEADQWLREAQQLGCIDRLVDETPELMPVKLFRRGLLRRENL